MFTVVNHYFCHEKRLAHGCVVTQSYGSGAEFFKDWRKIGSGSGFFFVWSNPTFNGALNDAIIWVIYDQNRKHIGAVANQEFFFF